MSVMELPGTRWPAARTGGFTLIEVVICVFIMMIVFAAIITAYIQTSYRAEWSGYSLAAQAAAIQQLEAAKAAVWDPLQATNKDEITQLPASTVVLLDLPVNGTNYVYVTNYTTITLIQVAGGYSNYMVKVDAVWPFRWKNQMLYFTNTVADYYAPD
jgi:type II secretory pathway pseudopilin PulG